MSVAARAKRWAPPEWARPAAAREALARFRSGFQGKLTRLDVSGNATYRVVTPAGTRYALRLYRPGRWSAAGIQAEHDLLGFLGPDLQIQPPLEGRDHETLQRTGVPGCYAALFPWVYGRSIRGAPRAVQLRRAGAYLARLHRRAAAFPLQASRVRWDQRELIDRSLRTLEREWPWRLPREPFPDLRFLAQQARDEWSELAPREGTLHGDYHWGNLKLLQGRVYPIDFDDFGTGPLAYDLGVVLYSTDPGPDTPHPHEALLEGYNGEAEVPIREREVHLFLWIRFLYIARWIFERSEIYTPDAFREDTLYHLEELGRLAHRLGWTRRNRLRW